MEFVISISRPGKSWNLSEVHGNSWKSNELGKKIFLKIEKMTDKSETGTHFMHYNAGNYV